MSRQWVKKLAAALSVLLLVLFTTRLMPAGPQEQRKPVPSAPAKEKAEPAPPGRVGEGPTKLEAFEAAIDTLLERFDTKPHPEPPIPDNPPPHEGAMIDTTYVIEPPDLILVEVLEALPGRPISGERLVRPDGTISLGFYGDVHLKGLTIPQAKLKILKHLRRFLSGEVLGLGSPEIDEPADNAVPAQNPAAPQADPFRLQEEKQPKRESGKPRTIPSSARVHSGRQEDENRRVFIRPRTAAGSRRLAIRQEEKKPNETQTPIKIPLEAGGHITIKIEIESRSAQTLDTAPAEARNRPVFIDPSESDRVFVDVTAYNSKNYFVEGDVTSPGRHPFTGNETVLDALTFAGGLITSAEPKDIRLVRPARGGKPAKVYKVDLEAIREKGDHTANYQIFPGDRLVVGRNDVVKKTVELDRLRLPLVDIVNSISQESTMLRSLNTTSPENHEVILRDLVEFWIQEMKRPEAKLDEQTLREALIKRLQIKPK